MAVAKTTVSGWANVYTCYGDKFVIGEVHPTLEELQENSFGEPVARIKIEFAVGEGLATGETVPLKPEIRDELKHRAQHFNAARR